MVLSGAVAGFEVHALEAGEAERPGVLSGHRVDAEAEQAVGARLVDAEHLRIEFPLLGHEVGVAHARQPRLLLRRRQPREDVALLAREPQDLLLHRRRQGRRGQEFPRGVARGADDERVGAEGLLVEERPGREAE